ncbi:MAG: hypothetical protein IPL65_19485 [Lewinellaceae bacterium]|nr:hypothetical protein [Lewinellaceae bacterium]
MKQFLPVLALSLLAMLLASCGNSGSRSYSHRDDDLDQIDQAIRNGHRMMQDYYGEDIDAYSWDLYERCQNGEARACKELSRFSKQSIQFMDRQMELDRIQHGDSWAKSFGR